jgi:hypothetical protein
MQNLINAMSRAETIYMYIALTAMLGSIAQNLFLAYGKGSFAIFLRHKRDLQFATTYLKVGILGYALWTCVAIVVFTLVFAQLGWLVGWMFGMLGALIYIPLYTRRLVLASKNRSILAEAELFRDYDLKVPNFRVKFKR